MNIQQILSAVQYNEKMTVGGAEVEHVSICETGTFRMGEDNIRVMVKLKSGRQFVILSGDLKTERLTRMAQ